MSDTKSFYSVKITLPSGEWIDHHGRKIKHIFFSKNLSGRAYYQDEVWYPLKSLGTLDRTLGEIPESPVQELSNWVITLDSIYNDGKFSTMDLLYSLKAINEENTDEEFNLIGCEAVLLLHDSSELNINIRSIIFNCSVTAVSSANGTTSITFSERIGAPVIAKKSAPIVFGNSAGEKNYWPVKMTKDLFGIDEIILSEKPYGSSGELFLYLEEKKDFIPVNFSNSVLSVDNTKITFQKDPNDRSIMVWGPMPDEALRIQDYTADHIRNQNEPVNCILGEKGNEENALVWTNQNLPEEIFALLPSYFMAGHYSNSRVQVGRASNTRERKDHSLDEPLVPLRLNEKPKMLSMWLNDYPSSISETAARYSSLSVAGYSSLKQIINLGTGSRVSHENPCVSGEPIIFLNHEKYDRNSFLYPTAWLNTDKLKEYNLSKPSNTFSNSNPLPPFYTNSAFHLKFQEYKSLPADATVSLLEANFDCVYNGFCFRAFFSEGESDKWSFETPLGKPQSLFKNRTTREFNFSMPPLYMGENCLFSDTQSCRLTIFFGREEPNKDDNPDFFTLRRLHIIRRINFPFSDSIKLYTSAKNDSGVEIANESFIIPALKSLLAEVNLSDYSITKDGELGNAIVNCVMADETAEFRAKIKTLAIASSAIIRMNKLGNGFTVSSLENRHKKKAIEIPWEILTLENNIFSFSMQTPMKDQIYSELELSYKKNIATGKYEHRILVSSFGIEHDGESSPPVAKDLEWSKLQNSLNRNSARGIKNLKSIENEWVRDREGAERAAYTYLSWCCAPLYTAQIKCVSHLLRNNADIDIGAFVWIDLPKYPKKLRETVWIVTAIAEDLESHIATISLLETWNAKNVPPERYLLTEEGDYLNAENYSHFKLEK